MEQSQGRSPQAVSVDGRIGQVLEYRYGNLQEDAGWRLARHICLPTGDGGFIVFAVTEMLTHKQTLLSSGGKERGITIAKGLKIILPPKKAQGTEKEKISNAN